MALDEELAVVESYLRVESVRYEERRAWRVDAEPAARVACVPPMLLQMLVENAVKHGIAASERGGEIVVTARRRGDRVFLQVTNPGVLGTNGGTRIGLANSRERLRLLYGDRASLSLEARDGHVVAEAVLPAEEAR